MLTTKVIGSDKRSLLYNSRQFDMNGFVYDVRDPKIPYHIIVFCVTVVLGK